MRRRWIGITVALSGYSLLLTYVAAWFVARNTNAAQYLFINSMFDAILGSGALWLDWQALRRWQQLAQRRGISARPTGDANGLAGDFPRADACLSRSSTAVVGLTSSVMFVLTFVLIWLSPFYSVTGLAAVLGAGLFMASEIGRGANRAK